MWVAETVGRRLLQYDLDGQEKFAARDVQASALAVDPATGNVWVSRSGGRLGGSCTDVYDPAGRHLASYGHGGYDIAYDARSKAFCATLVVPERLVRPPPCASSGSPLPMVEALSSDFENVYRPPMDKPP